MDYMLLRDYCPFKRGQVVRLGEQTAVKLMAQGVVVPYPMVLAGLSVAKVSPPERLPETKSIKQPAAHKTAEVAKKGKEEVSQ